LEWPNNRMFSRMDILKAPAIRNKPSINRQQQQLQKTSPNRKYLLLPRLILLNINSNLNWITKLRIRFSKVGMANIICFILIAIISNNTLMSLTMDLILICNLPYNQCNLAIIINKDTLSTLCNSKKITMVVWTKCL